MMEYGKQFLLSCNLFSLKDFSTIDIGHGYYLHSQSSLCIRLINQDGYGGVFLGTAVDPAQPEASNDTVLAQLVSSFSEGREALWSCLDRLSGRFVVFLWSEHTFHIYHDAFSSKSIYYSPVSECVGSHPALLESFCKDVELDERALASFVSQRNSGAWPYGALPYKNVEQLPPNHYLDILTFTSHRYWPRTEALSAYRELSKDQAVALFSSKLKNILLAFSYRSQLSLPVTAGYDSRLLLACCPDSVRNSSRFFTVVSHGEGMGIAVLDTPQYETVIAKDIVSRLGLNYSVFSMAPVSPDKVLLKNSSYLLTDKTQYRLKGFVSATEGTLFCSGNGPEVFRCFYYPDGNHPNPKMLSPEYLAAITGFANNLYAIQAMARWLDNLPEDLPLNVLDLLYWEDRMGSWQSTVTTFRESVMDEVLPCNSRELIAIALARPVEERKYPHRFVQSVIESSEPRLAGLGFNTSGWRGELRNTLRARIKHIMGRYPRSYSALDAVRKLKGKVRSK